MSWAVALVSATLAGVIGAVVGSWVTAKAASRSHTKEIAARKLELRHDRMLNAGAELVGATTAIMTVVSSFALLPRFSKSSRAYDFPVLIAPYQQAITTAAARLRPVADKELRVFVDDLIEATVSHVTKATLDLSRADLAAEQAALAAATSRVAAGLTDRGDVSSFASILTI